MPSVVRIGTSGWSYPHWRGRFFPVGMPATGHLRYAAERVDALEINTTFYGSARPTRFTAWRAGVADLEGFRFAVKGSRYITHMKKLRGVEAALANFFATGPLLLGATLGPFLWQLPPNLGYDEAVLEAFFQLLPRDAGAAQRLAGKHDARFAGRATTERGPGLTARAPLHHAVEPRHPSFEGDAFVRLCERQRVAIVHADTAGRHVALEAPGADVAYLRLHGSRKLYASRYRDDELLAWAARVRELAAAEVYVFFDNDARAYAAHDAIRLRDILADLLPLPRAADRDRRDERGPRARGARARRGAGVAVGRERRSGADPRR
jgi:uncharacterized protein YecE (DUF72 family)